MTTTTTDLAIAAPTVTSDQLDLIKRTVANGATDAELKLFLFDCARRGVHPLDKLLHFTKRGGKYTPVTSIDFMRAQAAMSGEMAGNEDAVFHDTEPGDENFHASVTVYRLTDRQRFPYTATARWEEYCPPAGQDHMWQKMPHTMLGKCAEALALRKAFPQQLAGLYAKEELDQAERLPSTPPEPTAADDGPDLAADIPEGTVLVTKIMALPTRNPNVKKYTLTLVGPNWPANQGTVSTINKQLAKIAADCRKDRAPAKVTTTHTEYGYDLATIERVEREIQIHADEPKQEEPTSPMLTDKDIPF